MTDAEMLSRIYRAVDRIRREGREFGKVELVVRDGVIKHVNVSYEILSEEDRGERKSSRVRGDSPIKGLSPIHTHDSVGTVP